MGRIFPLPLNFNKVKGGITVAKKDQEKVTCQYCGEEYSKAGIANHEKACSENPANQVEETVEPEVTVEAVETVETVEEPKTEAPEEQEQLEEVVKKPNMCDIKLADKVDCYIGDRYYRFKKGEEAQVPVQVKDILKRAGLLEAI